MRPHSLAALDTWTPISLNGRSTFVSVNGAFALPTRDSSASARASRARFRSSRSAAAAFAAVVAIPVGRIAAGMRGRGTPYADLKAEQPKEVVMGGAHR